MTQIHTAMSHASYRSFLLLAAIAATLTASMSGCMKEDSSDTGTGAGSVTDADGNIYRTVMIGNQEWMAENLRTTRYSDGTPIENPGADNPAWATNRNGAYSWYGNDKDSFGKKYGGLYNWHAVNTGKLCPAGWRVPSDEEWTKVNRHLAVNAGGRMKAAGTSEWDGANPDAANDTGFDALPGGVRVHSLSGMITSASGGFFFHEGRTGRWWTSCASSSANALHRSIHAGSGSIFRSHSPKGNGYSVRCIRE